MKFAILNFPKNGAAGPDGAVDDMSAWGAYAGAMAAAGVMCGGDRLADPESAVTVRLRGGVPATKHGSFVDGEARLGGYFVIDVDTIDDAVGWAKKSPAALSGAVEVRALA